MHARIPFHAILLVLAATLAWGCSTYRQDRLAARARVIPEDSVEGLWEGRWYDAKDPSHGGRIRAVLTRTGDTMYRMASRSQFWGIFAASYDNILLLTPTAPGEYLVQGDRDIWPFGHYTMTGRVDTAQFNGRFNIGKNSGVVEMTRVRSTSE